MRASPESLRRTRLKAGSAIVRRKPIGRRLLLAELEAGEAGDAHVLAGLRGDLGAKLLDRLALVAVRANVLLLEQGDLLGPLAELPLDDLLDDVVGLALLTCLGLEDLPLRSL